jgi:SAM-dependent methyltransferase
VEEFSRTQISGWVTAPAGKVGSKVSLRVNGIRVAAVRANDVIARTGDTEFRGFRFALRDLWHYVTTDDKLTVTIESEPLPIAGVGMHLHPDSNGTRSFRNLRRKLNNGHVFSRIGRLQLSKSVDEAWQREVLDFYESMRTVVKDALGYDLFVVYGSLLGAIRSNGFIAHDDDFDVAVIVDARTGAGAVAEVKKIAFALIDAGFDVKSRPTALHVYHPDRGSMKIDVFHLFFDEDGVLSFAFGVAGTTQIRQESWTGLVTHPMGVGEVLVPANAEDVLETIYGSGWRVPNPGFNWDLDRTHRTPASDVQLPIREEIYWANFYAKVEYTSGSTFCEWLNVRPGMTEHVVDIGCGDGRDSYAFGLAGRHVIGLDRSHIGVAHADRRAHEMGMHPRVQFQACDVSDAEALTVVLSRAIERAGDEPITFYARFFLHSIKPEVQDTLMSVVSEVARPGDRFAAEFRTAGDMNLPKVHTKHYRRFQDGPAFGIALREAYGFDVEFEIESAGLSPYKDEDPVLYRVVAVKH